MDQTAVKKKCKAVLFCTSPLQIINTQSALEKRTTLDGVERALSVVIIHPLLGPESKKYIESIGARLGCSQVLDFASCHQDMLTDQGDVSRREFRQREGFRHRVQWLMERYSQHQSQLSDRLELELGEVNEVYVRVKVGALERFFLGAVYGQVNWFGIEDGIGDYIPRSWPYSNLNLYEIRHRLRRTCILGAKCVLSTLLTGNWVRWREIYDLGQSKPGQVFSILPRRGAISTSQEFLLNIQSLDSQRSVLPKPSIVIFGTLLPGRYSDFSTQAEVDFYNQKIRLLMRKYNVSAEKIWYKHHPRLSRNDWEYKKNNLLCSVFDYDWTDVAEVEFLRPDLKAVYSVGSTSLLYARPLFNVPSFFWDLSNRKDVHPSVYKKYKYVASKYCIPTA